MSIEEMLDYCKTLFSDLKFNDLLVKFCKQSQAQASPGGADGEKSYTIYVDVEKVVKLNDIINQLPLIIKRDGNVSTSMNLIINADKA